MRLMTLVFTFFSFLCGGMALADQDQDAVASVLNLFHKAAAAHDFDRYFSLAADNFVFIGTDANERWDLKDFKAYVKPHFDKGKGWTYEAKDRHIDFAPGRRVAWFDETLQNAKFGTCRGTGVLIKQGKDWKISQYHLTIPVPNDLAETLVKMIQSPPKGK